MVSLLCLANIFYLSPPPHTQPPSFSGFVTDELMSYWILICWYFKWHKMRTRWAAGCHFSWGSFYELGDHGRTVNLLCSHDSIIMFLEVRWARELQASQSQKHPFILISFYVYFWRWKCFKEEEHLDCTILQNTRINSVYETDLLFNSKITYLYLFKITTENASKLSLSLAEMPEDSHRANWSRKFYNSHGESKDHVPGLVIAVHFVLI